MDLDERLAYWQRQLRLQDWDIDVRYATAEVMGGCTGKVSFNDQAKAAEISILPESEWGAPSLYYGTYDEEFFLVHELLHIQLISWKGDAVVRDTREFADKESAIDLMAWALVRLDRGERR